MKTLERDLAREFGDIKKRYRDQLIKVRVGTGELFRPILDQRFSSTDV